MRIFFKAWLIGLSPYLAILSRCMFASIVLVFSHVALGGSADSTLTLESAVTRTLSQNPRLRVFKFRDEALQGHADTATLKPAIEIGADIENIGGTGSFSGVGGSELTISISSIVELGDKRRARVAAISAKRAQLDAERQIDALDLLGEVTRRYIDVLAAQERVALAQEAESLAREALQTVQTRAAAAAAPDAEVLRAQAALSQAGLLVSAEQSQLDYARVALSALWGDTELTFDLVAGDLYRVGQMTGFEELFERVQQNPFIQAFTGEERLREAELRLARTQSESSLRWSVGARRLQETSDMALIAGVSIPLFTAERNQGAVRSAMAAHEEVAVRREAALIKLRTQLFNAFQNRQQASLTVATLQNSTLPLLNEALSDTRAAYESGRYSYLEWVVARQELIDARRTLIDAAAAALSYGAEIEQLTAEPLLSPLSQTN